MQTLEYTPLEKIKIKRTVKRIDYVASNCACKNVLDLGCYDETALLKRNTGMWLHEQIAEVAKYVYGIDNSKSLLDKHVSTSRNSKIVYGDVTDLKMLDDFCPDIIIAGELVEHLPCALDFLKRIKSLYSGKQLICTTVNATSFTNSALSLLKRESCHKDHLQIYSYKTFNTLCLLAGFEDWEILTYHVCFTEMILKSKGIKKIIVKIAEKFFNFAEKIFPLASGGLILNVKKI
jgi:2-polyprenyl-3-methyl-5-hydroxy-6-metoxy-1,4-benzoquinol methylase